MYCGGTQGGATAFSPWVDRICKADNGSPGGGSDHLLSGLLSSDSNMADDNDDLLIGYRDRNLRRKWR